MRKRDEVREQIYEIVSDDKLTYTQIVERIINLPSIAVVDREAGLPSNPYKFFDPSINEEILYKENHKIYARAQQDMLKQGWVKEVKDE